MHKKCQNVTGPTESSILKKGETIQANNGKGFEGSMGRVDAFTNIPKTLFLGNGQSDNLQNNSGVSWSSKMPGKMRCE